MKIKKHKEYNFGDSKIITENSFYDPVLGKCWNVKTKDNNEIWLPETSIKNKKG